MSPALACGRLQHDWRSCWRWEPACCPYQLPVLLAGSKLPGVAGLSCGHRLEQLRPLPPKKTLKSTPGARNPACGPPAPQLARFAGLARLPAHPAHRVHARLRESGGCRT
jgi:hypothetical protein